MSGYLKAKVICQADVLPESAEAQNGTYQAVLTDEMRQAARMQEFLAQHEAERKFWKNLHKFRIR